MRPDKMVYFLYLAQLVATRSTCRDKHVGCVLTDDGLHIVATGYNGAPHGVEHCIDRSYCEKKLTGHCRAIHAEQNALAHRYGATPKFCFCTLEPCMTCARAMRAAGVKVVYWITPTNPEKSGASIFGQNWIQVKVPNTLQMCMEKVRDYHTALNYPIVIQPMGNVISSLTQQQARDLVLATVDELMEILHSFNWKPWKAYNKEPKVDKENFLEEVCDVLFFLDSLLMNFGFSWEDCCRRLEDKLVENYKRIETGYHN